MRSRSARERMVFQKPTRYPAIYAEHAFVTGSRHEGDWRVVERPQAGPLWDEVKDGSRRTRRMSGASSSAAARALTGGLPDVILMDEPCSTLDTISTADRGLRGAQAALSIVM